MRQVSLQIGVSIAAALMLCAPVRAEPVEDFYRGKTVNILVGFSAGGGYDLYARLLGRHIGRHIPGNPTVTVQNMPEFADAWNCPKGAKMARGEGERCRIW